MTARLIQINESEYVTVHIGSFTSLVYSMYLLLRMIHFEGKGFVSVT